MLYFKLGEHFTATVPLNNYPLDGKFITKIKIEGVIQEICKSSDNSFYFVARIESILDNDLLNEHMNRNIVLEIPQKKCAKIYKASSKSYNEILNEMRLV